MYLDVLGRTDRRCYMRCYIWPASASVVEAGLQRTSSSFCLGPGHASDSGIDRHSSSEQ